MPALQLVCECVHMKISANCNDKTNVWLCRSGDGGQGEIVQKGSGRWVQNNKYMSGGQQAKKIWLPASELGRRLCRHTALLVAFLSAASNKQSAICAQRKILRHTALILYLVSHIHLKT